jgi:hypothetical protein
MDPPDETWLQATVTVKVSRRAIRAVAQAIRTGTREALTWAARHLTDRLITLVISIILAMLWSYWTHA